MRRLSDATSQLQQLQARMGEDAARLQQFQDEVGKQAAELKRLQAVEVHAGKLQADLTGLLTQNDQLRKQLATPDDSSSDSKFA